MLGFLAFFTISIAVMGAAAVWSWHDMHSVAMAIAAACIAGAGVCWVMAVVTSIQRARPEDRNKQQAAAE